MPDIFPNEVFPGDADVAALDGTTDQTTGLPYIAKGVGPTSDPPYDIQYNRRQWRENRRLALVTEGLVVDEGALKFGVYPFNYTLGGQHKRFDGATNQAMPDNTVKFVFVDAANALQIADAFPADVSAFVPLARVTTTNGAMTIETASGHARLSVPPLLPRIGMAVGAETADTFRVSLQLEDPAGNPIARRWLAEIWLADAAFGDLAASAPTGGVSVATGQQLGAALVPGKHLKAISSSDGLIEVDVSDTAAPTFFLMAAGGGADLAASAAITFST